MKLFIDNVPNLVTEVAIIAPLPELFRPQDVLQMSEKDLVAITAESKETKARREELTSELAVLLDGAKTCKEYATYQNRSTLKPFPIPKSSLSNGNSQRCSLRKGPC